LITDNINAVCIIFSGNDYFPAMNACRRIFLIWVIAPIFWFPVFSQTEKQGDNLPTDYLSPSFHAARRKALRDIMPANSVAVIFSYPEEVFSKDVNYVYHPNPDLFYFSGYKEPNAVLLIFKETQHDGDSSYNELFFVQHRDPRAEQWTGKRLGVEGVKSQLGFKRVYNGDAFANFPIDFRKYNIIYDVFPDTAGGHDPGGLRSLVRSFAKRSSVKSMDNTMSRWLEYIYQDGNPNNIMRMMTIFKTRIDSSIYKSDPLIQELAAKPDSSNLETFKSRYSSIGNGVIGFNKYTNMLRGIKTPEEITLLKKSIWISAIAHRTCMQAVDPKMSERELEGIMLYVHKKYGAEDEGYPPIVGAGGNGCILHYEENNAVELKNQLVLMDVGAEYHGYSADVTRTFPANGKFSEEQKAVYQLVYDAQEAAFAICKAGISFDSLENRTTEVLAAGMIKLGLIKDAKDVKKYYPHGMSHHLGLDVHDKGHYGNLEEHMVITVEPGIYVPAGSPCDKKWWNIGVRIEDDVLIGTNGYELLSAEAPRKWQDVEKAIAEKSFFDAAKFPVMK
jgi:Xaa-Pro aminopeptidase